MDESTPHKPERPAPDTAQIDLEDAALDDIERLDRFLRHKNPSAADRFQTTIFPFFRRMAAAPGIGRRWSKAPKHAEIRERVMPFGQSAYVIRYTVEPDCIVILRVHHAREGK